ncbi:hypothetical protein ACP6PL_15425 [Dapis sp. BLCC M126]|uniref:hypothetical protein n=1 Tax=Dapis sp. BLCC M126 TaxID=3400189 RepID=UPI003CFA4140
MKLIQRLVTYLSLFLVFVSCLWILLIDPSWAYTHKSDVETTSKISLNLDPAYTHKSNVKITSKIPPNPDFNGDVNYISDFAWQTFIALNWSAHCDGKPFPEEGIKIWEKPDPPRVWEFYSYPEQVFLSKGENPKDEHGKFKHQFSPPQCLPEINNEKLKSEYLAKYLAELPKLRLQEGTSKYEGEISILDPKFPLVDRKGNYIMNEGRINPIEVNQIIEKGWYDAKNLKDFYSSSNFLLVCSEKKSLNEGVGRISDYCNDQHNNEGAIEVKAAWMVAKDMKEEEKKKYYITQRGIEVDTEDGNKVPKIVDVALVGFHILRKTSNAGWIFATFEHINNAPDNKDIEKQKNTDENYHLYDPNCKGEICPENNHSTAKKPYLWGLKETDISPKSPDHVTNTIYAMTKTMGKYEPQIHSQITREHPLSEEVKEINKHWTTSQKWGEEKVWPQYYQLIGVQWLSSPEVVVKTDYDEYLVGNEHLANVALEPFNQQNNSCFKCHQNKAKLPDGKSFADLSFFMRRAEDSSNNSN